MGGLAKLPKDILEDLLSRDAAMMIFRKFLRTKGSEEMLDFWIAAHDLESSGASDGTKINKIYKTFIEPGSPREINVPSWVLDNINIQLNYRSATIFQEAQSEVFDMLERLTGQYFQESDQYAEYLEEKESRRKKPPLHCLAESRWFNPMDADLEADARKEIETQLEFDRLKENWTFAIWLLGCGEAGKSTFYKQIRSLYKSQMDVGVIKQTVTTLRENVRDTIQRLLGYATDEAFISTYGLQSLPKISEDAVAVINNLDSGMKFNNQIAQTIDETWKSPLMQEVYKMAKITFGFSRTLRTTWSIHCVFPLPSHLLLRICSALV